MKKKEIPKYTMVIGVSFQLFFTPYIVFADVPLFNPLNPGESIVVEEVIDQETLETTTIGETIETTETTETLETTETIETTEEVQKEQPKAIKKEKKTTKSKALYLTDELFDEEEELILPSDPFAGGGDAPTEIPTLVQMVSVLAGTVLYGERENEIELSSLF
ncbi:hypothetical protein ACYSNO_00215 [Enterococcus sp. LJL98]